MSKSDEKTITLSEKTFLRLPLPAWFLLVGILTTCVLAWADQKHVNVTTAENVEELTSLVASNRKIANSENAVVKSEVKDLTVKLETFSSLLIRIDERTQRIDKAVDRIENRK